MNQKINTAEKILDVVVRDCFRPKKKSRREKMGEKIKQDIKIAYEELKKEELSADELEVLKETYQALGNDSVQSLVDIISFLTLFVSLVTLITSIDNMDKCPHIIWFLLIGMLACTISGLIRVLKISKENSCFRNNIIAAMMLLHDREQEQINH